MKTPKETLELFLANTTNPEVLRHIIEADATYISLNFSNPELKKILPWTGTRKGPNAFIYTFAGVNEFWTINAFEVQEIFAENENVAVFGSFSYTSKTLNQQATSPFSILAKVRNGKIYHFMFMEDTFATAATFKVSGKVTYHSDPLKGEVEI
ncbi:MAG: nuclear transport factor 2 family protein [Bacteroidales bacterium]|nr:nuclear transport factor 2 family protein [Bacteroidales bacterium]